MYKLNELKGNQLFGSAFSFITKNNNGSKNAYHNNAHLYGVFCDVIKMCDFYEISQNEKNTIGIAALFHDFGHNGKIGNDDVNITTSISGFYDWVEFVLITKLNKKLLDIDFKLVEKLIKVTEFPSRPDPKTILEKIMMDADMLSTYRDNWFDSVIVGLSKEYNITVEKQIENQLKFINILTFFTVYANNIHDKYKNDLIVELNHLKSIFN